VPLSASDDVPHQVAFEDATVPPPRPSVAKSLAKSVAKSVAKSHVAKSLITAPERRPERGSDTRRPARKIIMQNYLGVGNR
jgi:hypothetical protein